MQSPWIKQYEFIGELVLDYLSGPTSYHRNTFRSVLNEVQCNKIGLDQMTQQLEEMLQSKMSHALDLYTVDEFEDRVYRPTKADHIRAMLTGSYPYAHQCFNSILLKWNRDLFYGPHKIRIVKRSSSSSWTYLMIHYTNWDYVQHRAVPCFPAKTIVCSNTQELEQEINRMNNAHQLAL